MNTFKLTTVAMVLAAVFPLLGCDPSDRNPDGGTSEQSPADSGGLNAPDASSPDGSSPDASTPAPAITSFSPTSGPAGTAVTIAGSGFAAAPSGNAVDFNGTAATVTNASATSLTTTVPAGATSGPIHVAVGGQTAVSAGSFTVTTVPPPDAPANPYTLPAAASSSSLFLSWSAVTGATGYNVYRSTAAGVAIAAANRVNASPVASAPFIDSGLSANTTYFYRVTALGAGGESAGSAEASGKTKPATLSWTVRTSPTTEPLNAVAWSGSKFVAVGGNPLTTNTNVILTSSDGVSWTRFTGTLPSTAVYPLFGATWTGSQFIGVGGPGLVLTSPDGSSWTQVVANSTEPFADILLDGGLYVVVGGSQGSPSTVSTSADLSAWTSRTPRPFPPTNRLNKVLKAGTNLLAVGNNGEMLTSTDGVSWAAGNNNAGSGADLYGAAWNGSTLVVVGGGAATAGPLPSEVLTAAGATGPWGLQDPGLSQSLRDVLWTGSKFVAVGAHGAVASSPDGTTWTTENSNTSAILNRVASSGGRLVAVGAGGTIVSYP